MTDLLSRLFVKDYKNPSSPRVRTAYGTMVSVTGILINLILFVSKLLVGTLTASVAITADAMNNLSDAGSQLVSLISFRIAAKPADREHPFGHARIEYVASMIVSFLILYVGVELVRGSVEKLITPVVPIFHVATIVVLAVSILCKLWLALFNFKLGRVINSGVMRATATDSLSDAIATAAVLLSIVIAPLLPASVSPYIDPVMGLIVAVLIFVAGGRILNDTKNSILGEAPCAETVETIRRVVAEYPEALGIHDMVVHNYGPSHVLASLHVEVDGSGDIFKIHDAIDNMEKQIGEELRIECTIHMDPIVTDDAKILELREAVKKKICEIDERLNIHDFRFVEGHTHTNLIFDIVMPFEMKMEEGELKRRVEEKVSELPGGTYFAVVTVDRE